MAATDGGKHSVIEANLSRATSFPISSTTRKGVAITIRPFAWNGAVFSVRAQDIVEVSPWYDRWADLEEKNGNDEDGVGGVIHSLYVKDAAEGLKEYSVDFGSAPVAAFDDFLDLLAGCGAVEIEVSSPHLEETEGEQATTGNAGEASPPSAESGSRRP